ncbi:MAG: hypothetical protein KAH17_07565 [Bacteroidales bacterium]|nr:hypothetical protein [Bacteroidales bacterium]
MKLLQLVLICGMLSGLFSCIPEGETQSFEGEWSCQETSEIFMESMKENMKGSTGTTIFPVYFAQDASFENKYYIDNFYQLGSGQQVTIMVSGGRTITIETQTVNGIEFSGSGVVSSDYNTIDLIYTADDGGGQIDHVTSEYTR